jgi:hypothetical protein
MNVTFAENILRYMNIIQHYFSGFFPWDLPVVKISPERVTGSEQCKSSGGNATFSRWTGMFRDGISSIPGETVIPLWLGRHFLVCENRVYHKKVAEGIMADLWRDFWICETWTGQEVTQLHDRYTMMIIICLATEYVFFVMTFWNTTNLTWNYYKGNKDKYHLGDKTKKNGMDRAYSAHEGNKNWIRGFCVETWKTSFRRPTGRKDRNINQAHSLPDTVSFLKSCPNCQENASN